MTAGYRDEAASREATIAELRKQVARLETEKAMLQRPRAVRLSIRRMLSWTCEWGPPAAAIIAISGIVAWWIQVVIRREIQPHCYYVSPEASHSDQAPPWRRRAPRWFILGARLYSADLSTGEDFPTQREAWDFLVAHTDKVCR